MLKKVMSIVFIVISRVMGMVLAIYIANFAFGIISKAPCFISSDAFPNFKQNLC